MTCPFFFLTLWFGLATPQSAIQQPLETIREAIRLAEQGQYQAALKSLNEMLQRFPGEPLLLYYRGMVRLKTGQTEEAERDFQSAVAGGAPFAEAHVQLSVLHMSRGEHLRALNRLQEATQAFPWDPRTWSLLAGVQRAMGEPDEAAASLESALNLEPGNPALLEELTRLYLELDRVQDALRCGEKLLEKLPDGPVSYRLLGLALERSGQLERIGELFDRAIQRGINDPALARLNARAVVLMAKAQPDQAGRLTTRALEAHRALEMASGSPDEAASRHHLSGLLLNLAGLQEDAAAQLLRAVQNEPANEEYLLSLILLLTQRGNFEQAIPILRKGLEINPGSLELLSSLVDAFLRYGDARSAMELVPDLVQIDSSRPETHMLKARILEAAGDFEEALQSYGRTLELDPEQVAAWFLKGRLLGRMGRLQEAAGALVRALEHEPEFPEALLELGKLLIREERLPDAENLLLKAAGLEPHPPEVHFQLGVLYRRKGESEKARAEFRIFEKLKADAQ